RSRHPPGSVWRDALFFVGLLEAKLAILVGLLTVTRREPCRLTNGPFTSMSAIAKFRRPLRVVTSRSSGSALPTLESHYRPQAVIVPNAPKQSFARRTSGAPDYRPESRKK